MHLVKQKQQVVATADDIGPNFPIKIELLAFCLFVFFQPFFFYFPMTVFLGSRVHHNGDDPRENNS